MKKLMVGIWCCGLLLAAHAHAAAINKCKKADGSWYYTDQQCPADSQLKESVSKKPARTHSALGQATEIVNFGEGIYQQFSKAQSIIKMAAVEGRKCEWGITVKGGPLDCVKFMEIIVEGGAYTQAMAKIAALLEEDKNKELSASDYNEVLADAKKVVKYKNYMLTSLGVN
jgi:hypothetical protein